MNTEELHFNLNAYKENDQLIDAAKFLIHQYELDSPNLAGIDFRPELDEKSILMTTEGVLGEPQMVKIPKNFLDFDLNLILNLLAHEMLHVRQKASHNLVEDKNEREFQAYYEMLFHKVFPQIPDVSDFHKKFFGEKALTYYKRMGENSPLQQKYLSEKEEIEKLITSL